MVSALFTQLLSSITELICVEVVLACLGLLASIILALDMQGGLPGKAKHDTCTLDAASAQSGDKPLTSTSSVSTCPGSDSSRSDLNSPRSSCDEEGVQDATSYHGLLEEHVSAGDHRGAWRLVTKMQINGASPCWTTCSILLNTTTESIESVSRVLLLADAIEAPMTDTFFMALAEVCIRVGRLDFLSKQIDKLERHGIQSCFSVESYSVLIKAYGEVHDMKRVWDLWNKLHSEQVLLTSAVVSLMVGVLVGSGQSTEAWRLIKGLEGYDEAGLLIKGAENVLNNDIYSNVLKGFASAQQTEKAMKLYKEMKSMQIQPNKEAFDAILHAFAQRGSMEQVPALMEDMKEAALPDVETYSTLVKGFCNAGSLDRALKIFKGMKVREKCSPGEVVYNELLGGCIKESRPDEALELLGEMRTTEVAPTSHNLGLLVKLLARCSRLDEAFHMLEDIRNEFSVKIDLQVYNRLIQGCFHNGQANKALSVYDKINREGPPMPDVMTYTAMVRGLVRMGIMDKAIELVRCAHGIGVSDHAPPGLDAGCLDEMISALGGEDSEQGAALLSELRGRLPVRGALDASGQKIQWSNGDVWQRATSSGI